MIKELRDELVTFISTITGLAKCDRYNGEFEEGAEWYPSLPCAFVNFLSIKPVSYSADARILGKNKFAVDIYVAGKYDSSEIAELITNELNEAEIEADDYFYKIKISEIALLGFIKSVEVWKINIELI